MARVAQEQLARIYAEGYGLDICCTRSFNHCGPGQTDRFVVSSIVKQFVRIAHGLQDPVIHIGNGSIVRDFIDVRDVVEAYQFLLTTGKTGGSLQYLQRKGTINSVILLCCFLNMYHIHVQINQEQSQIRPIDNPTDCRQ